MICVVMIMFCVFFRVMLNGFRLLLFLECLLLIVVQLLVSFQFVQVVKFFRDFMLFFVSVFIIWVVRFLNLIRLFFVFSVWVVFRVVVVCVLRYFCVWVCSLFVVFLLMLLMISSLLILIQLIFLRLVKFLEISNCVKNLLIFSVVWNRVVCVLNFF